MNKPLQIQWDFERKYHQMTGDFIKIYYCQDCYEMYFEDEMKKHNGHSYSLLYSGLNACIIPERREKCARCGTTWQVSLLDGNGCCICVETEKLKKEILENEESPLESKIRLLKSQKSLNRSLKILIASETGLAIVMVHLIWRLLS